VVPGDAGSKLIAVARECQGGLTADEADTIERWIVDSDAQEQ
jgi:hypothetical protein